jgi:alpha,alpha-trehalose phosphorylase
MAIPYDDALDVHPQNEDFTRNAVWNFKRTDAAKYPLLLNYPYFDLYRRQVVKQPDLVLAMHFRGDAFTPNQKARNFAYYEAITVRDSSLSACTQAVMAAEVGHLELAYDYFGEAALIDIADLNHNTKDGLHIASLAGAWSAVVHGFGGMRDYEGRLSLAPRLPPALTRLSFRLAFRDRRLQVEVRDSQATYTVMEGDALEISHHGDRITLEPGEPLTLEVPAAPHRPEPTQPPGREPLRRRFSPR